MHNGQPMTRAAMMQLLSEFADSLPDDGEGAEYGADGGDMASGDMGGAKPPGEVEISVEAKPEGMGKRCPTCGQPMQ